MDTFVQRGFFFCLQGLTNVWFLRFTSGFLRFTSGFLRFTSGFRDLRAIHEIYDLSRI